MVLLFNFIFAAVGMMLFKNNDPQHFGAFRCARATRHRLTLL